MIMEGTLVNAITVIAGGLGGTLLRRRIPGEMQEALLQALGLATVVIGLKMALEARNLLLVIFSLALGGVVGEALHIEEGLERLGRWAEGRLGLEAPTGTFARGFITASLLFCVGPMTILGAIQDGLGQTPVLLYTKSLLDGAASVALAAGLGLGVPFAALTVLGYQGLLTVAAAAAKELLTGGMVNAMTATGGALILGLGINLLQLRRIRVANLLPALVVATVLAAATPTLGMLTRFLSP
jgi:uncharacterized membrane protein YqgA involved in biofilm formation